jgi:enoyl-CoA hydratase
MAEHSAGFTVERQADGGVTLVTLDRPEVLNAMTSAMHAGLGELWLDLGRDPATRAIVITGGGRAFSAGNDLRQPDSTPANVPDLARRIANLVYGIVELEKPVVSAVKGPAVGAGLVLAIAADISIVAADAILLDGQTRMGVAAGEHAILLWPLLCGMAKAKYHLLTSEPLRGFEAERIGLVTEAVPAERVLERALDVAAQLARGSQQAIRWTKRSLSHAALKARPAFEQSLALELLGIVGPDAAEARSAFREKREPQFPSAQLAPPAIVY